MEGLETLLHDHGTCEWSRRESGAVGRRVGAALSCANAKWGMRVREIAWANPAILVCERGDARDTGRRTWHRRGSRASLSRADNQRVTVRGERCSFQVGKSLGSNFYSMATTTAADPPRHVACKLPSCAWPLFRSMLYFSCAGGLRRLLLCESSHRGGTPP